jgi:hypothetical protein
MAVRHVVWLTFKDGVDPARIDEHMEACRALADQVPAALAVECGATFTDRAGGFTHCIIVSLADRDALPAYLEHPAHRAVGAALLADTSNISVMDIEV